MEIHVVKDDEESGPYDVDEVNRLLAAGSLQPSDLAWHAGLSDWQPLHTIAGVQAATAMSSATPPPLPQVYVGFWRRAIAAVADSILISVITMPIVLSIYGWDYFAEDAPLIAGPADLFVTWIFPALAVILFWIYRQATPGKIMVSARIMDARTLQKPSVGQLLIRYFGYYISILPLGLGILWIAFDRRKQGWHDKIAGTVVVQDRSDTSDRELR